MKIAFLMVSLLVSVSAFAGPKKVVKEDPIARGQFACKWAYGATDSREITASVLALGCDTSKHFSVTYSGQAPNSPELATFLACCTGK
jgi:hypothetical protein